MSTHRKRTRGPRPFVLAGAMFQGSAGRTAATATAASLALAGAATAAASGGIAQAEPRQTPAQVTSEVDGLYRQADAATQKYNGAKEEADRSRASLNSLREQAARTQGRLNAARDALGSVVSAQYRAGGLDPAMQLALSSDPESFLQSASVAERAATQNAQAVRRVRAEMNQLGRLHSTADDRLATLTAQQRQLAGRKAEINDKLSTAKRLLHRLTAAERARYEQGSANARTGHDYTGASGSAGPMNASATTRATSTPGSSGTTEASRAGALAASRSALTRKGKGATSGRAAAAVAFAYHALGKPYVWGATGPNSFDCSGLTQAAWRAAGVSLPRTTYTQINAGKRVSRSQLAPGDLVFFYSGISHVGLYVGGGKMIHAPHPGAPVRVAPIDEMPFAGATRPA